MKKEKQVFNSVYKNFSNNIIKIMNEKEKQDLYAQINLLLDKNLIDYKLYEEVMKSLKENW
jgi:hypothetical protein